MRKLSVSMCSLLVQAIFVMMISADSSSMQSSSKPTTRATKSKTNFIPCSQSCDGGDVNYILTASVRTMELKLGDKVYQYRGRTYSNSTSPNFMGPTMRVKPGQSIFIKLVNNLTTPVSIGPNPPTAQDYWRMLQNPGEHIKYQRYKKRVEDPSLLKVDHPNMPHNFDNTNLHLHGLDVEVHMFDPINTHNPFAPHVDIKPNQCYCYQFHVPDHHPEGMYWYHPHLHGSTAIQMWSGMIGILYVEREHEHELENITNNNNNNITIVNQQPPNNPSFRQSLIDYNIRNTQEFVIWDPAFKEVEGQPTHNLEVDEFLLGQTTLSKIHPFLVNGVLNPIFYTTVGEILHLRVLCATIENENTFIIYPEGKEHLHWEDSDAQIVPFWIVGSDGVMYRRPIQKNIVVMSGGQREEILILFDKPGKYVISQQGIQGMQFFDMRGHPHDQILATIEVKSPTDNLLVPTIPIAEMEFTPGYKEEESIKPENIAGAETIIFSMGANFDQVPFPQYYVNGKPFNPDEIRFHAHPGEAREYTLINANHNAHPFHIHVNRFQVKEMGSELSTEKYPVLKSVLDYHPDVWRDTVMVPPNGRTKIWVQYKEYTGKTVLHCHFLAHEDTGMMATVFIGDKDWVFRLEEHIQWIIGLFAGVSIASIFLMVYFRCKRTPVYSVVSMNELKSKAMD